jgi:hypothetical protein
LHTLSGTIRQAARKSRPCFFVPGSNYQPVPYSTCLLRIAQAWLGRNRRIELDPTTVSCQRSEWRSPNAAPRKPMRIRRVAACRAARAAGAPSGPTVFVAFSER